MVTKRKVKEKTDDKKILKQVREQLPTSILEVEIEMFGHHQKVIDESNEHARIIRNTILDAVYKRYKQMNRTKKYKKVYSLYIELLKKINNTDDKEKVKEIKKQKDFYSEQLQEFQLEFGVTFDYVRKEAEELQKRFPKAQAVIALKMAERVWLSMERILYGDAEKPRFIGKGFFPSLEGKQNERCIMLKQNKDKNFFVSYCGEKMYLKIRKNDLFVEETLSHIASYFQNSVSIDTKNIENFNNGKPLQSTYRVKYNRIIRKEVRGKYRYFVQIVVEGEPVAKRKKDGSFRHSYGVGRIGGDIGTQSLAIVSNNVAELKNLAERTQRSRERQIFLLQRKQDRSRRSTNPDCFDEKGRCIKKIEDKSNRYIKNQKKLRNLQRIDAENRKYAHNEEANHLRSLGDECIIETMCFKSFQKRAKETSVNQKTGRINRKKRFGKSILNRSPGYFVAQLKYRFGLSGGKVNEVNTWTFKASQYDHMLDDSNKKQLSQRWHVFENGVKVQRDLYSAFLLYCSDSSFTKPNKQLCDSHFHDFNLLHENCIEQIKKERRNIRNSGIKAS